MRSLTSLAAAVLLAACAAPSDAGDADSDASEDTVDTTPRVDPDHGARPAEALALPDFVALDLDGAERGPDDLRGRPTVMWFYPAAGTSGCTVEGCGYRDLHAEFEALGIRIVGVSFDAPDENAAWAQEQAFPFALWTDRDRTLAVHYGSAASAAQAVPRRVTKILDAQGVLVWEYPVVAVGTHPSEVLEDCRALFGTP
ncbi:MAG: peroxiredoxin [Alphaproteobacteria bacterium]|nr:peroxiredoxin [Alphaproteobacteria bacterium]